MVVIGQFSSPEDASSQGLVYSSRLKTLHLFRTIFNDWEPWIQALAINQSANVCGVTAAISGALASSRLRNLLPGLSRARARWIPIPLSVCVPGALAIIFHEKLVTNDILLQETACPVCVETRAISGQVAMGVGLTSASAYAGSLLVGDMLSLRWVPKSVGGLLTFTRDTASRSSMFLISLTVFHMLVTGALVHFQRESYETVLKELERRAEADKIGFKDRTVNLDRN